MKKIAFLTILSLFMADLANAYPPDNAAVLYYKNMEDFQKPDEGLWDQICELPMSSESASEELKTFIKKNRNLINELQIASEIERCDWGLDLSQGFEMMMPGLSQIKNFHYLLLADSAIQASQGYIPAALESNLAVRRLGHHMSNDTLIGFLMSSSLNRKSDEALAHLLGTYPINEKTLAEFKNELLWENYQPKSIKHPLMMEKEVCLQEIPIMTPERYTKILQGGSGNKETDKRVIEYLKNTDSESRKRAAALFSKYYDDIFAVLEKPYKQAYEGIRAVSEKMGKDAEKNDDALLPAILLPRLSKCYSLGTGWKTNYDAMLTALDVYIIAAKTGKLPTELPASTYIDHFSGKPFLYEVTKDGFTLKCQQEDLSKKTIPEFSYKLPQ